MQLTKEQTALYSKYIQQINQTALQKNIAQGAVKNILINEIVEKVNEHSYASKDTKNQYIDVFNRLLKQNKDINFNEINLLLNKAKTKATYDLYRSAIKFCIARHISLLQKKSDTERKNKNVEKMKKYTNIAFQLAIILEEQFSINKNFVPLNRANSKRKSLKKMPTIDEILENMNEDQKLRFFDQLMIYELFGVRPAELKKGILLNVKRDEKSDEIIITAKILGVKVNKHSGQEERFCTTSVDLDNKYHIALVKRIFKQKFQGGLNVIQSEQGYNALKKWFYRKYGDKNISLYSFRHKIASQLKSNKVPDDIIAAYLGHRTDKSQSYYGYYQNSRSGGRKLDAKATNKIRNTKNNNFDKIFIKKRNITTKFKFS